MNWPETIRQAFQASGELATVTVTHASTLTNSEASAISNALEMAASASEGATELTVRAQSGRLQGHVSKGAILSDGGTPYTATAEARVVTGISTVSVPITPALAAAKSEGDPITFTDPSPAFNLEGRIMPVRIDDSHFRGTERPEGKIHILNPGGTFQPREADTVTATLTRPGHPDRVVTGQVTDIEFQPSGWDVGI